MGKYNLLDEKWIPVILNEKGSIEKVSILELFKNASSYLALGGDTETQKFALLRFLLAIPQTVYSRFKMNGEPYEFFEVDEKLMQLEDVEEEDSEEYKYDLGNTWSELWNEKKYSKILFDYLEMWKDRFYLFDDKYPFYQVTADVVAEDKINKASPTSISGKTMNRIISESGNKIALFSPKNEFNNNKEILKEDEITRWLITFQGYVGTSDKVMFGKEKYTASKGWIYDIGGIYLEGDNLFETLMLNTILGNRDNFYYKKQKPCWEYSGQEIIDRYLVKNDPDNIAELYTTWSRAIYINPETDVEKPFEMQVVKVPDIDHRDMFLEPMTVYRENKQGPNKDSFTPRKHISNQSMWRSFGNIFLVGSGEDNVQIPGVIRWFSEISEIIGRDKIITINAISMEDDGNATSWMPVGEIHDRLDIHDIIITDGRNDGWNNIVYDLVEETKFAVSVIYRNLLADISDMRRFKGTAFIDENISEMYYIIDHPFRDWISSIDIKSSKEEKVFEWRKTVKGLILKSAEEIALKSGSREYKGIIVKRKNEPITESCIKNLAKSYSRFKYFLDKKIKTKEQEYAESK